MREGRNSGGRNRVSGLSCSFFLAMSVIAGSVVIEKIPLAALVGTMWMLVIDIFDKSNGNGYIGNLCTVANHNFSTNTTFQILMDIRREASKNCNSSFGTGNQNGIQ